MTPPSTAAGTTTEPGAGPKFADYAAQLIAEQDARKASFESRALSVITTSGTLVTILFALVAVLTQAKDFKLPSSAQLPVALSLVFFVGAAVLALVANLPMKYKGVTAANVADKVWRHWDEDENKALRVLTRTRLDIYDAARTANTIKGRCLAVAMGSEIAAVIALAIAVGLILTA